VSSILLTRWRIDTQPARESAAARETLWPREDPSICTPDGEVLQAGAGRTDLAVRMAGGLPLLGCKAAADVIRSDATKTSMSTSGRPVPRAGLDARDTGQK
jgi:hypothetical protein